MTLFTIALEKVRQERDAVFSLLDNFRLQIDITNAKLHALDFAIAAMEAETPPEVVEAKPARAKPGEIESAIREKLFANGPLSIDTLTVFVGHKPDSIRSVLKRMVSMGDVVKDGETYKLANREAAKAAE